MPQGVEFDESRIEFKPAPSVASAFLEPVAIQSTVVVKNFLNSGKNAVIITLNDLTLSKNIANQVVGDLRVPVNFTIYANKQTSFKNYVYVDNSSDFILDKSFSKFTTDSEGVTGSTSNNVYAFVNDIVFNPVKELLSIVRGSGYLDNGALLLGRDSESSTEVGKPTLLNFTLINNKDLADTGGSYQNLKILGLVPKINNNISIESKDYTTTNTRLVGLLENAKENTNQNHYFDIFYTYKGFVNTSGQDINSLQAYAASYLDGLTPSDLIKPSTRSTIDYSRVQSIVLIQKQGTTFLSDNRISFDMNFIADTFNTNEIAKNYFGSSFFVSTEPGRATLANTTQTNVESYTISGKAYFDSNNNGTFEAGDIVLSNKKVEITYPSTSGSKVESVSTDAYGNYFLRVYESGTYSVSMVNANHYETKYDLGSTLTQISPNVNLSLTNKDVNIDVVTNLKGNVLRLTNELLDHEGIIVTTNEISEIDYILNINGYPYNGVAINEANEEVTVVNGVLSMKFGEILRVPSLGQQTT